MPDPSRTDEVAVNDHLATMGVGLADRYTIGIFDPAQEDAVHSDAPPPPVDVLDVTVVGIGLFPDEVVQDETDRFERMLLTPVFTVGKHEPQETDLLRQRRPPAEPRPSWSAYHFATVAVGAGLEAEVHVANDAVRFAQPAGIAKTAQGDALRAKIKEGVDAPFLVSL